MNKYQVGRALHQVLEKALIGETVGYRELIEELGCNPKVAKRLFEIVTKYRKSTKFGKWIEFFKKYNHNWEVYIETYFGDIRPDIVLINQKKRKIVIVDIKTGQKTKKKITKVLIQLFKYYTVFKNLFAGFAINIYIFWAKLGEFETYSHLVSELYANVHKQYTRFNHNLTQGGENAKGEKSTEPTFVYGV